MCVCVCVCVCTNHSLATCGGVYTDHSLSVGGGGMLMASVPMRFFISTVRMRRVLDTSCMAFFTYLYSVALWKYLDWVSLPR